MFRGSHEWSLTDNCLFDGYYWSQNNIWNFGVGEISSERIFSRCKFITEMLGLFLCTRTSFTNFTSECWSLRKRSNLLGSCENFQGEYGRDEVSSVDHSFDLGNAESSIFSWRSSWWSQEVVPESSGITRVLEEGRDGYNRPIPVCKLTNPSGGPRDLRQVLGVTWNSQAKSVCISHVKWYRKLQSFKYSIETFYTFGSCRKLHTERSCEHQSWRDWQNLMWRSWRV